MTNMVSKKSKSKPKSFFKSKEHIAECMYKVITTLNLIWQHAEPIENREKFTPAKQVFQVRFVSRLIFIIFFVLHFLCGVYKVDIFSRYLTMLLKN